MKKTNKVKQAPVSVIKTLLAELRALVADLDKRITSLEKKPAKRKAPKVMRTTTRSNLKALSCRRIIP